ncbi:DUF3488 and transglutaminase-like domain-containing protein [Thermomonospora sp. CIF 1]|uniref:DUF3488 and transglutaminase-like domain-containing protein n=1 Tax=Thermomonospora sp. CIF 1 TaxID=1916083 RepID=UPI000AFE5C6F|nr:DUF3488 and transglutaminase-like domain-containing protein [Thermomonospora sp. CIF 1]PKK13626.1 MAG: transglutaminase [Thermomonospora sp. CIF 1]
MRVHLTIVAAVATLLSSIGLYPLFEGTGWAWSGVGAIATVAAAGALSRRLRLPAVADSPVALFFLLAYLTLRYAPGQALLGAVPTPASLARLAELAGEGWETANRYAAPVPPGPGIELLATSGIGAVAVMVDLLAVRLRRAAAAGLPLLALYSVPAAIREESLSWVAFALGAAGFLWLLLIDSREQTRAWGRPVPPRSAAARRIRPHPMASSGNRVGLAAVAIAVAVPTVVPGVHPRGPFGLGAGAGESGSQTVTTPDPLVSLKRELTRQSDEVVLVYRTDDQAPDYLRLFALDRFDGDHWTYSPLQSSPRDRITEGRPLPAPPGLSAVRSRPVTTRISVASHVRNMNFLPVPYAPAMVSIGGDWRVHAPSLMIYSLRDEAAGRTYTVSSLRAEPTPRQLAQAPSPAAEVLRRYLGVPGDLPPQVRRLTEQITAGARSQYEQARRLQRWFTTGDRFVYDTSAIAPRATSDLVDFLLVNRRGYCEQFAASMALMARLLGIPARVAMGYTSGTQAPDGRWVVRSRDAHAWPELYFEGAGWVRFEPTPAGPGGQGSATVPSYTRESGEDNRQPQASAPDAAEPSPSQAAQTPDATPGAGRLADRDAPQAGREMAADAADGGGPFGWIAAGLLTALVLSAPMAARSLARRRRWAQVAPAGAAGRRLAGGGRGGGQAPSDPGAAAHAAWRELRAEAIDHGLAWRSGESPRATARRLSRTLEPGSPAVAALERLARAEERARYARVPAPADTLGEDIRIVREAFGAAVDRRTRWRARLAPPSTMEGLREGAARFAADLGRFDARRLGVVLRRVFRR